MTRLTKAPYLTTQPRAYQDEAIIIAGTQAFSTVQREMIITARGLAYNKNMVTLAEEQLERAQDLQIVHKKQKIASINKAGDLSEDEIERIIYSLANHSELDRLYFFDWTSGGDRENWSDKLARVRAGEDMVNNALVEAPKVDLSHCSTRQALEAFLSWHKEPLRRDTTLGKTYTYTGTHWAEINDEILRRKVLAFYRENDADFTTNRVNKLADVVILSLAEMPVTQGEYIGFNNGALNKLTGEFLAHSEALGLREIDNFTLNTDSLETPIFNQWMVFLTNGDKKKIDVLLAGLYMVLTNQHKWTLFLEITGVAGAGKSVFGEVAQILNGTKNTAIISLKSIEDPKGRACMLNKSLAYSPDQANYTGSADALKAITGGDEVSIKILYKDEIKARLTPVFLLVTNYPLLFTDRNGGVARRRVIIPFNKQIPATKRDIHFLDKIKGELYGIVHLLLARFNADPLEAKFILEQQKDEQSAIDIKQQSNHLIDFASYLTVQPVNETDAPREQAKIINGLYYGSQLSKRPKHDTLYGAYTHYCDCQNIKGVLSVQAFKAALPDALKNTGQSAEIKTRIKDGSQITNIYWRRHHAEIFREWEG
ncbi:D5 N like family protein [Pasteurellaceae bacterium HPA106]|uniref:DNA primase family protein n=1 Tax=Spirabiliibacterium pneumoniae TaxID=221400 RepID=UPI001AAD34E3|nr:DUF5906 domain-containing protein [Spirabiliibacterium pneumoniae]MBE2896232.1 D5 N like family protein [Spirabiliibacterium pneumoniae]